MNIDPKVDLVFKKLFATEENKDLLMSLINSIVPKNEQVVKVELKNPYQVSDYITGKNSILDIKATDENGIFYDIEMQIKHYDFYPKRTLYYWAKMFSKQIDKSPNKTKHTVYKELTKCIVISFMDFVYFKEDEDYFRCMTIQDRKTNKQHQSLDYLDLYFIELPKFKEELTIMKNVRTAQDEWLTFLKKGYDENGVAQYLHFDDPLVEKAREQLKIMDFNFDEQEYYEGQQKMISDHNAAVEQLEREKAEIDTQKAGIDTQKAEIDTQKAEIDTQKAGIDTQKAEIEAKKIENDTQKALLLKEKQEIERKTKEFALKNLETAKRLLEMGLNNEIIAIATMLSEDEIEKIRKEQ